MEWKDLLHLSDFEVAHELSLSLPWLAVSWFAAAHEHYLLARTIRHRTKALITYNMFYHVEHHLFPTVPTCKLPILAGRLDAAAPELAAKKVF